MAFRDAKLLIFALGTLQAQENVREACLRSRGYTIKPLDVLGAEVHCLPLLTKPAAGTLSELEDELAQRGFLVFPGHGTLQGDELIRISKYFGGQEVESRHTEHPEAVHPGVLRLSNKKKHGIRLVGPQWHQDGSFERAIFSHIVFNAVRMPATGGETAIADLGAAYDSLSLELKDEWTHLASINAYSGAVHPLVHRHPISKKLVLFLHLGQSGAIIRWSNVSCVAGCTADWTQFHAMDPEMEPDLRGRDYRILSEQEVVKLMRKYDAVLSDPRHHVVYRHRPGDLVVLDNLAVAHRAMPSSHEKCNGLRILHRTTVRGMANLDPPAQSGLPPFLYIFGENPIQDGGVWQSSDYFGAGFQWNRTALMRY
eukprot:gnl/MRDRNA2_/MRDRNA2_68264_c0_seq1.p1 gnl/MRDRNA2_/MRDRNA2_68264_c0~~gnl/MRDRNA2_/MRDRNA2_68264_c0_seq1.p1  ORF type:complete len:369 (+),score=47.41 gnl/MRDRNA2_/MRDRNA2_68264_c0_seq1:114-1220(+)